MKRIFKKWGFIETGELPTVEHYNFALAINYMSYILAVAAFVGVIIK